MEIKNGDIVRLHSDDTRDWVAIYHTNCDMSKREKFNKNIKDHTGFYLFGGLWYDGDVLTDKPYGKCAGQLRRGAWNNITVVGNIANKEDLEKYKRNERI